MLVQKELINSLLKFIETEYSNGWITVKTGNIVNGEEEYYHIYLDAAATMPKAYREKQKEIFKNYKDGDATKYSFVRTTPTEMQNQIKTTFYNLSNKYKSKQIAAIGTTTLDKSCGGVCCSRMTNNVCTIFLNGNLSKEANINSWKESIKNKHNVGTDNVVESILTHEFGHSILNEYIDTKLKVRVEEIYHDYIKNVKSKDINNVDYVSKYARESYSEFYAECFAQATLSKNPSKYAKMILDETLKYKKRNNIVLSEKTNKKETEKELDLNDFWIEGGGLGYPLNFEEYEKKRKQKNKKSDK